MQEEGLFRVPGSAEEIKTISSNFEKGWFILAVDLVLIGVDGHCDLSGYEISSIAGVLKLFFRCMPEPLFTFEHYPTFMSVARMYHRAFVIYYKN